MIVACWERSSTPVTLTAAPSAVTANSAAVGDTRLVAAAPSRLITSVEPSTEAPDADGQPCAAGSVRNTTEACADSPSGSVAVMVTTVS